MFKINCFIERVIMNIKKYYRVYRSNDDINCLILDKYKFDKLLILLLNVILLKLLVMMKVTDEIHINVAEV